MSAFQPETLCLTSGETLIQSPPVDLSPCFLAALISLNTSTYARLQNDPSFLPASPLAAELPVSLAA